MNNQNFSYRASSDSIITIAFAALFLLLPLIFTNQVFETASLPRQIFISLIASLTLFVFSFKIFTQQLKLNLSFLHIGFLIFFSWALLSLLWSTDPKNSVIELTQLAMYFIIAFIASQLDIKKQIQPVFVFIFLGASISATIGILQAFHLNPLDLKMTTSLASTFNNKNHASVYFDLIIPLALINLLTTKSYTKYISAITYTLSLTFILLAKTKGSALGFFVFTLFFIVFIYRNKSLQKQILQKRNIVTYLLLTLIIPILIYNLSTFNFSQTTPQQETHWNPGLSNQSTSIRLAWYKNAYAMLKQQPFLGVGFGGFRNGFTPYASNPNIVSSLTEDQAVLQLHNDPYQIILELGILGGGLVIGIFSYIVLRSSSILSIIEIKNNTAYILLGSFLALISSITHSFFDFPLHLPTSATVFWFITGVIILLLNKYSEKMTIFKPTLSKKSSLVLFLFIFILSVHSFDLYHRYFTASKLTYLASVSVKKNHNCSQGLNEIDEAINLFFSDPFIRQRYIQVHMACDASSESKLQAMNKVLDYDSSNARARLTRAAIHLENRELELAKFDLVYLTQVLPHRPSAYLGLGDIATITKKFTLAHKYYEKVIELDPQNQHAIMMLQRLKDNGV